jgi:acyl dehydratase
MIYWEDFKVGDTAEIGSHTFTAESIVEFARQFDPQPMHLDRAAAKEGFFGTLTASGWHVCAVAMRLKVDAYLNRSKAMGSPGVDEIRWLLPVREGDVIRYTRTVLESRPSKSRPHIGLVRQRWDAFNQRGEQVMTSTGWGMFGRRPAAESPA